MGEVLQILSYSKLNKTKTLVSAREVMAKNVKKKNPMAQKHNLKRFQRTQGISLKNWSIKKDSYSKKALGTLLQNIKKENEQKCKR